MQLSREVEGEAGLGSPRDGRWDRHQDVGHDLLAAEGERESISTVLPQATAPSQLCFPSPLLPLWSGRRLGARSSSSDPLEGPPPVSRPLPSFTPRSELEPCLEPSYTNVHLLRQHPPKKAAQRLERDSEAKETRVSPLLPFSTGGCRGGGKNVPCSAVSQTSDICHQTLLSAMNWVSVLPYIPPWKTCHILVPFHATWAGPSFCSGTAKAGRAER